MTNLSSMRCLIVDDEFPAREGMRNLLLTHPGVEIVGEADGVEDALRLSAANRPGIVFLDVQLRGETGFDFFTAWSRPFRRLFLSRPTTALLSRRSGWMRWTICSNPSIPRNLPLGRAPGETRNKAGLR